jgi:hypothetical protein
MAMPGFSAESSLYKTREPYRMLGGPDGLAGAEVVSPQRWSCRCTAWCSGPDPILNGQSQGFCCATECIWIPDIIRVPFF